MSTFRIILNLSLAVSAMYLLSSCGTSVYYVKPADWEEETARDSAIRAFSTAYSGKTIFIDPGHGGDDRAGTGPAGDVVEADVNLRVALALRDYLRQAGANVLMSRETDAPVPLPARPQQANANNAEVFISIHHNAADNRFTNYTATFYHGRPGEPGYKPSSHDLARYIQRDLAFVMGNPGSLATFDGAMSDYLVYPGKGFAVLRDANMTSVLVEASFFTSAYEEQRLRIREFNEIQAWGIFRGLGRYLRAGVPRLEYASPPYFEESRPKLEIQVTDNSEIGDESIRVWIDGKEEGFSYNAKTNRITSTPSEELAPGFHRLAAQVRNRNENSSAPFELHFSIGVPLSVLRLTVDPPVLPPDEEALALVSIEAADSTGKPVPDGLPLRFTSSIGHDTVLYTAGGAATLRLSPSGRQSVSLQVSNGPVKAEGALTTSPDALFTRGLVMSSDGKPVSRALITMPDGRRASGSETGEYAIAGIKTDGLEVKVTAPGYFGKTEALSGAGVQDPIVLAPIARGALHGKRVLVDLTDHSVAKEEDRPDVKAAEHLAELLEHSGALVDRLYLLSREARHSAITAAKGATIWQFSLKRSASRMTARINGASGAKILADRLISATREYTYVGIQPMAYRLQPREEIPSLRQINLVLPSPGPRSYDKTLAPLFSRNIAWTAYAALLAAEGYAQKGSKNVEVTVVEKGSGAPAAFALVRLNHSLVAMTDAKGTARFRAVSVGEDEVHAVDPTLHEITGVKTEVLP